MSVLSVRDRPEQLPSKEPLVPIKTCGIEILISNQYHLMKQLLLCRMKKSLATEFNTYGRIL